VFLALLVPEDQISGHLQTLATIAAKLNDKHILKALRQASTPQSLLNGLAL
jgi:PTS system nitrogen regulatory IIA component